MIPNSLTKLAILALALSTLGGVADADRLITSDGRVLSVKKAREHPDGGYRLVFEHGELICPEKFVKSVEIEGDMSDYVPQNEDEAKKLEEGFVRYRGKWMSKPAYLAELQKEAEESSARVAELAAHADFFDGWEKETKHFIFKTNTSPELLEYYADLLETYYTLMNKRVGIKPTPSLRRTKMKVNIYKSRRDFQKTTGSPYGVAGYFSFLDEELNFYHDFEEPAISDWVALHETTHLLTYLIEPQSWPRIWINEGVADYFGSSEIRRDKKGKLEIIPGKIQVDRILTVQQAIKVAEEGGSSSEDRFGADRPFVPLETLFRVEKSNFSAFEYAHSWSFVYFLNNHKKYQKGFKRFFKDHYTLPKGVDYTWESFPNKAGTAKIIPWQEVRRLLLKNLGVKDKDVPRLQQEWLDYIASIEIDAPMARFKRAVRVVNQMQSDDYEAALVDLNFAIDAGLEDARAFATRGDLRVMMGGRGDTSAVEADYRKAIELDPLNPSYHFKLAQALSGSGFSFSFMGGSISFHDEEGLQLDGTPEELAEAKTEFGLAASLAPESEYYLEHFRDFMEAYEKQ